MGLDDLRQTRLNMIILFSSRPLSVCVGVLFNRRNKEKYVLNCLTVHCSISTMRRKESDTVQRQRLVQLDREKERKNCILLMMTMVRCRRLKNVRENENARARSRERKRGEKEERGGKRGEGLHERINVSNIAFVIRSEKKKNRATEEKRRRRRRRRRCLCRRATFSSGLPSVDDVLIEPVKGAAMEKELMASHRVL